MSHDSSRPRWIENKKTYSSFLYHLYFIVGLVEVFQLDITVEVLCLISLSHVFFVVLIPPSLTRSLYGGALLSTHMT
jgi:hypothetical protein